MNKKEVNCHCRICEKPTAEGRTVYPYFVRMCKTHNRQEEKEWLAQTNWGKSNGKFL